MQCFSLQIQSTADGRYQWLIAHSNAPLESRFSPLIHSQPVYPSFQGALDVGALMLARVCGQPYANAAGDASSAALDTHIDRAPEVGGSPV